MYGRKVKLRFLFVIIILITLILTTFSSKDFKIKNVVRVKVIRTIAINKNLSLTFRPYMAQKLNTLAAR